VRCPGEACEAILAAFFLVGVIAGIIVVIVAVMLARPQCAHHQR
jgi:hypothetical protein